MYLEHNSSNSLLGTVGLVDYDTVDVSNLHRQVLHTEDKVGMSKVDSAILDLKRFNFYVHIFLDNFYLRMHTNLLKFLI